MSDWIEVHEGVGFVAVDSLRPSELSPGMHRLGVHLVDDGAARPVHVPHNAGADGPLRASVASRGVPAVTVEIGDPQVIDRDKVRLIRVVIRDVFEEFGMLPPDGERAVHGAIECHKSAWHFTDTGGLLDVTARLWARVKKGDVLATLCDPWGRRLRTYRAPKESVIIGKATNPVVRTEGRIVHLGVEGAPTG